MMQLLIASRRGAGGTGEEGFEGLYDCMGSNTTAVDRAISRKVRYLRKLGHSEIVTQCLG